MADWHLITGEYPPQPGGVSDYSYLVAAGLAAAGDTVHVWCPPSSGQTPDPPRVDGVVVHRELGRIDPADLRRVGQMLNRYPGPRRLLLQWVPHAYGYRSMNLAFCSWLWKRVTADDDSLEIMVHEPSLDFSKAGSWKHNGAAAVHRLMAVILVRAARRVWFSIPAWEARWRPYALGRRVPFAWAPVPSNVPTVDDPIAVAEIRRRYAPGKAPILGHFGTYGAYTAEQLTALLPRILSDCDSHALLLGRGGHDWRDKLLRKHPELAGRVHTTGGLPPADLSRHLSACDVMVQPYPDGVNSRHGTMMGALAHGLPIVTTSGVLTESLWMESGAVALAPVQDASALVDLTRQLLADEAQRGCLGGAAKALYQTRFDLRHTIAALRSGNSELG